MTSLPSPIAAGWPERYRSSHRLKISVYGWAATAAFGFFGFARSLHSTYEVRGIGFAIVLIVAGLTLSLRAARAVLVVNNDGVIVRGKYRTRKIPYARIETFGAKWSLDHRFLTITLVDDRRIKVDAVAVIANHRTDDPDLLPDQIARHLNEVLEQRRPPRTTKKKRR